MLPLPKPEPGGSLDDLRQFVNLDDEQYPLFIVDLTSKFRPRGPHGISEYNGEPGCAKSTLARVVKALVDPNVAPLRSLPSSERDLAFASANSWLLSFDNLSHLEPAMSDALCRLATGSGLGTRKLFSDDDEALFDGQRIAVNGISELGTRSDFADRVIRYWLPVIPDDRRRTEAEFWAAFEKARPKILGALCGLIGCALSWLPKVELDQASRMADFCQWGSAVSLALKWDAGTFWAAYAANRDQAHTAAVDNSLIMPYIALAVGRGGQTWKGTAQKLLDAITNRAADSLTVKSPLWPKTARKLSADLRLLAVSLRKEGWTIVFPEDEQSGGGRGRTLTLISPPAVQP